MKRDGLTIIEVVCALAVIALLMAITLPAVQSMRETSRRLACQNHLKQFGLAIHNYESDHGMYPPGSASQSLSGPYIALLPYTEEAVLWQLVSNVHSFQNNFLDQQFQEELATPRRLWLCPSGGLPTSNSGNVSYAGNQGTGQKRFGFNGIFGTLPHPSMGLRDYLGTGPIRPASVTDGLSNTAAMAEWRAGLGSSPGAKAWWAWRTPESYSEPQDLERLAARCESLPPWPMQYGWQGHPKGGPWYSPNLGNCLYNHVLPPNSPSCSDSSVQSGIFSAGSQHPGGANVLFADGHVRLVADQTDREVWREMGSRCQSAIRIP